MKTAVSTPKAPAAIGPYSQAIAYGNLFYTSGQMGMDPATGKLCEGLEAQTRMALENLKAVLTEAGSDFSKVLKSLVFITDMANFAMVNSIYEEYFPAPFPARSCVAVAELPKGALVEIEVVAAL